MLWLYKLERKLGRFAIRNLMLFVVIGQAGIFLIDYLFPVYQAVSLINLVPSLVLHGQVWRLLTFIFVPTGGSIWVIILSLYFYYFIGATLEKVWGSFKFGMFYFLNILAAIAAAFITSVFTPFGYGVNYFVNLSLLVAFAFVSPDYEFLLFFFLRIKAKWLALAQAVFSIVILIIADWSTRAAVLASLVVLVMFFWRDVFSVFRKATRFNKSRNHFRSQMRDWEREFSRNQRRARRQDENWQDDQDNEE